MTDTCIDCSQTSCTVTCADACRALLCHGFPCTTAVIAVTGASGGDEEDGSTSDEQELQADEFQQALGECDNCV